LVLAAVALNYFAYNFIKIHRTLRTSPAMAAGVTDRLWSVEDLVTLWEAYEQRRAEREAWRLEGTVAMFSPEEIATIKTGIKALEKARDESRDEPIRKLIQGWIEEQKQRLDFGTKSK
jgi:hypothetical protein